MFKKDAGALASRRRVVKKDEFIDNNNNNNDTIKQSAALIRIQKDYTDLEIPDNVQLIKIDELNYNFIIKPSTGYWTGMITYISYNQL